jgi:hypothetical protein
MAMIPKTICVKPLLDSVQASLLEDKTQESKQRETYYYQHFPTVELTPLESLESPSMSPSMSPMSFIQSPHRQPGVRIVLGRRGPGPTDWIHGGRPDGSRTP